ncbi:MAG: hypothetical protein Q8S84_05595 [bacterium]|nr:hypothetical protein [bacterium]MDP3380962.1 hypothetical protein [bacterium]
MLKFIISKLFSLLTLFIEFIISYLFNESILIAKSKFIHDSLVTIGIIHNDIKLIIELGSHSAHEGKIEKAHLLTILLNL